MLDPAVGEEAVVLKVVFFTGIYRNDDVDVGEDEGQSFKGVDKALEDLGRITKGPGAFEHSEWGGDGGFRDVLRNHSDLVLCLPQVDLEGDFSAMRRGGELLNMQKGIPAGRSHDVEDL